MGIGPKFMHRSCKNGPRFWIKSLPGSFWLLPLKVTFTCGEIYKMGGYCSERDATVYNRVRPAKGQYNVVR